MPMDITYLSLTVMDPRFSYSEIVCIIPGWLGICSILFNTHA